MTPMSPLGYYIQSYSPAIVSTISRYVGLQNVVSRRRGTISPLRRYPQLIGPQLIGLTGYSSEKPTNLKSSRKDTPLKALKTSQAVSGMTRSQGKSVLKYVPPSNVNPAASLKAAKNMKARLSTEKANSQTDYARETVEGTVYKVQSGYQRDFL